MLMRERSGLPAWIDTTQKGSLPGFTIKDLVRPLFKVQKRRVA